MDRAGGRGATVGDWEALGQVAQALVEDLTPEGVGAVVVQQSQRLFHSSLAAVWMHEPAAGELRLLAQSGFSDASAAELRTLSLEASSPTARAARTGQVVEVTDMEAVGAEFAF